MNTTEVPAAVFSNLAKASQKQQVSSAAADFDRLAQLHAGAPVEGASFESLREDLAADLADHYPRVTEIGSQVSDRGALRAAKWGEKVTAAQRSVIDRYLSKGEAILEGKAIYVCEACGFIFLGADPPPICPACKAPRTRFSPVK
jgi:rubrerythrin